MLSQHCENLLHGVGEQPAFRERSGLLLCSHLPSPHIEDGGYDDNGDYSIRDLPLDQDLEIQAQADIEETSAFG